MYKGGIYTLIFHALPHSRYSEVIQSNNSEMQAHGDVQQGSVVGRQP